MPPPRLPAWLAGDHGHLVVDDEAAGELRKDGTDTYDYGCC
ncbi:MAG TPA: hypothetical protein VNB06_20615 [Thermoanaerobaculia bacterium]|nr:hypothetical protein [Thermoanaerobaculia bacterium]